MSAADEVVSRPPRAGWTVVAAKELADDLRNARFPVLLVILALAAAGTVYFASDAIKSAASTVSGAPSLFIQMFTVAPDQVPSFAALVGFLIPLIGIGFGFDAINGERSQGTLPRLLSQPIHRDDVINGKFAAGLAIIATMLVALTALVAALGIIRLGITPSAEEILRLLVWLLVSIVYVGLWLAFATLCSVALRRSASSALVAIGVWIGVTLFAVFLVSAIASLLAPAGTNASAADQLANARWTEFLSRLSPAQLYQDATLVLLNPSVRTITPSLIQSAQADRAVASVLSLDQSLLLVWPQVVALVGLTVACFAGAYVLFLRQEVRA